MALNVGSAFLRVPWVLRPGKRFYLEVLVRCWRSPTWNQASLGITEHPATLQDIFLAKGPRKQGVKGSGALGGHPRTSNTSTRLPVSEVAAGAAPR
jgi:hypothetical protein